MSTIDEIIALLDGMRASSHAMPDGTHLHVAITQALREQAAEIERLMGALAKARDGLSCGLWDYGPGQSEHDQCDELIAEIDEILKGAK